jgi:Mce-associated membrane protein
VEDQPADSGDLTTDPAATSRGRRWLPWRRTTTAAAQSDPSPAAEDAEPGSEKSAPRVPTGKSRRTSRPAPKPDVADPDTAEEETADPEGESTPEPEPVLVPHRPAGKRLLVAATAASVVFVGAGAFAGATLQPYLADRAAVHTKLNIARTATEAITTLWSYTPEDMATLPDRSSRYLSGGFATEYRRYIDAIVSTNEQAKVTNTTQVMGTAVESLTPTEATALVYTNSVSTSPVSKNIPSLRYLSYRLTMERDGSDWLITGMNAVTKLDLSPQL